MALRRRGTAEGGVDLLTAAAPVLVAVIGALVLLRLYPLPLRLLSRPAARLRGTVLYLGLARAGGVCAIVLLAVGLASLAWLCIRQIGGQTGDVLGAVEQLGELLILLVAAAYLHA